MKSTDFFQNFSRERRGQSLVDILIGLAIISLGISLAAILVYGGQSVLVDRGNATQARALARAGLEGAALSIRNNWNGIADGTYGLSFASGTWQLVNASDTQSIFNRQIMVSTTASNQRQIKSIVSWQASPTRQLNVEEDTLVTNWQAIQATGGHTGGTGLTGNWQNPQTLGSINLGPNEQATAIAVLNKIAYLTTQISASNKPTFFIVNVTNGQNPVISSSLTTGASLLSVAITNTYAYVGNSSSSSQLLIINVSNQSNPVVAASYALPGISGDGDIGNTVFYYNNKVYLGTKKVAGPEFHVIDVSNPSNPLEVGNYNVNADINDIYVINNTAYLATSDGGQVVKILNVANPINITQIGGFSPPGGEAGQSLYLVGNILYLGRTSGSNDFVIADVTNPAQTKLLSTTNLGGASVNGIVVRDYLAFLATNNSNAEFQAWNISSSTKPTLWSQYNFPEVATGIDYESNIVYCAVRSNAGLRIITSQ